MKPEQSESKEKLELIASKKINNNPELYKVIDFLNKSLNDKKVMFGLRKDKINETMIISIYET